MDNKDLDKIVAELATPTNSFILPHYYRWYQLGKISKEKFGDYLVGYIFALYECGKITYEEKDTYFWYVRDNLSHEI